MATVDRRIELHNKLVEILGSKNVYFQPPSNIKLKYPCIIYHYGIGRSFHADNKNYVYIDAYEVKVIDSDPDSQLPFKLLDSFEMIRRERPYASDGLYHNQFILFY